MSRCDACPFYHLSNVCGCYDAYAHLPLFLSSVCVSCYLVSGHVYLCDRGCPFSHLWTVCVFPCAVCLSRNLSDFYTFRLNPVLLILSIFFLSLSFWAFSCFFFLLCQTSHFRSDVPSCRAYWTLRCLMKSFFFFSSSSYVSCDHFAPPFPPVQVCPVFYMKTKSREPFSRVRVAPALFRTFTKR